MSSGERRLLYSSTLIPSWTCWRDVAYSLGIDYGLNDTDQGAGVIIHEGRKFLDHVESEEFTPATALRLLNKTVDEGDLASLVQNLKSLADNWRGFLHVDELRILVD